MAYTIDSDVRAALFDVDGTLIETGQVWSVLVKSPEVARLKHLWLQTTAYPHYILSKIGVMGQAEFRDRWVRLMAWLMAGWTQDQAQAIYDETVLANMVPVLRPDMRAILKLHKGAGHPVLLVSTMFEGIVNRFAQHMGADVGLGSVVEMRDGRCTGRIVGETCSSGRKVDFARRYLEQHHPGITLAECAAYADSRSDIPFLEGVGHPVATYPDGAMRAAAGERDWIIYE